MSSLSALEHSQPDFQRWLQSQLTRRCQANPRYTLRAFAGLLQMDPSTVSQLLAGKRKASTKVVSAICERLSVTPDQRKLFDVQIKKRRESRSSRTESVDDAETLSSPGDFQIFASDALAVVSDWVHYAIIELTEVEQFKYKPAWIARSLGVTTSEVRIAVSRLIRLGVLREENGSLIKTHKSFTNFEPGFTAAALKSLQRQLLEKALDAIDNCPQEDKDITSMTMSIDPELLPEARKKIARFRRDLCAFLENGSQTRVYNLCLQLYPVSKEIPSNPRGVQ